MLASSMTTHNADQSAHTIRVDGSHSKTGNATPTAKPASNHERSIPVFIAAESPFPSAVWAEETVYVTITVDVLPTAGSSPQQSWRTVTTPCAHHAGNPDSSLPEKRAAIARDPTVTTAIRGEIIEDLPESNSNVVLDLNSMVENYSPTSTFTIEAPPPISEAVPLYVSTATVEATQYVDSTTTAVVEAPAVATPAMISTRIFKPPSPEDEPGYWLKGGIASVGPHHHDLKRDEPTFDATAYSNEVRPTIQARDWVSQFQNFASTSSSKVNPEDQSSFEEHLTKSNKARRWLRRLMVTSVVTTKNGVVITSVALILGGPSTTTLGDLGTFSLSDTSIQGTSTTPPGPSLSTSFIVVISTPSTQSSSMTRSERPSAEVDPSRTGLSSTASSTSTSVPVPETLEWDYWKGTKWQKTLGAEKEIRSAAVEEKIKVSGWKRAENSVSPWVWTFGVILVALAFSCMLVTKAPSLFAH